jgi:hypothetical protein
MIGRIVLPVRVVSDLNLRQTDGPDRSRAISCQQGCRIFALLDAFVGFQQQHTEGAALMDLISQEHL